MDWLFSINPTHLWQTLLAQTAPTPNTSEVELLRKQLDFINSENARLGAEFAKRLDVISQANKDLNESFKTFVDTMRFVLVIFGFLGVVVAFVFGKNLDDAKKVAREATRQEVDQRVSTLVQAEIESVKRTLQRERVIGETIVQYYLPNTLQSPNEFKLLQARGFRDVRYAKDVQQLQRSSADVVILDLENATTSTQQKFSTLSEVDRETEAKTQIDLLLDRLPSSTVLVVYVRSVVKYLYGLPRDRYVSPANNPVTLIGMVADAAYVVAGSTYVDR
jgi:hypothetical protein